MELKKDFLENIKKCKWLSRCGEIDNFAFDVKILDKEATLLSINSSKWESIWLEAREDFASYLRKNNNAIYEREWNTHSKKYRAEYVNPLCDILQTKFPNDEKHKTLINLVRSNIIILFMYNLYSDYYKSRFLDEMLEIYLSGHMPCGWEGNYPHGKFEVF